MSYIKLQGKVEHITEYIMHTKCQINATLIGNAMCSGLSWSTKQMKLAHLLVYHLFSSATSHSEVSFAMGVRTFLVFSADFDDLSGVLVVFCLNQIIHSYIQK